MCNLHLFNPENDLALGIGCKNYTPPPHAAALHRAGSLLPMWWAENGDRIIAPPSMIIHAEELREKFGLHGDIGYDGNAATLSPWGWSLDAKRQFISAGVPENISDISGHSIIPSDDAIEKIRRLSHRRTSIDILTALDYPHQLPIETTDPETVLNIELSHPGCFIKSPWSCSGRGVFNASTLDASTLRKRAEGIINRQESVMVEKGLNKTMDFAVLFFSDKDCVHFRGLSLFQTQNRGMYTGNIVAPQPIIRHLLASHLNLDELDTLISKLEKILTSLVVPHYRGWLGVDMMTHILNGKELIMPCVELNLRMTMGVAAMKIQEKIGNNSPKLLNWEHNTTPNPGATTLLPPLEGFALRLKDL